ncbi:MAG TPA: UbiA family prenyltransferase [Nitrososphaerales archaeon]|nr:UbiA family prenyltransferase [Nitrososphaerales archaeon]
MRPLSVVYRELILGGHLLALGTASIAGAAAYLFGRSPTVVLLVMAYLFSFGAYMMNRSAEMDQDLASHPERTSYLARRRRVLPGVVAGSFIVGYALAATVSLIFFVALLVPLALSILYSVGSKRLVGLIGTTKLKQKLLLKNVSIAFGWSLIPILVGLYFGGFDGPLLLLGPFIFLRLMTNTIVFDIRDAEGDRQNHIKTLPTELGVARSFDVVGAIDALSAAYLIALLALGLVPAFALTLMLLPIYSTIYRGFAMQSNANLSFICDVVADAEYLLWGPLIYIGKLFI